MLRSPALDGRARPGSRSNSGCVMAWKEALADLKAGCFVSSLFGFLAAGNRRISDTIAVCQAVILQGTS